MDSFSSALQELKDYFGREFLLGVFFPVLIFVGASLALYYEITQGLGTALAAWEMLSLQLQVLSFLGGIIAVTVLAYLIYNFQYSIVRLFEGYWPHTLQWLRNLRTDLYKRRLKYLDELKKSSQSAMEKKEIEAEQFAFYPPPIHLDKLMPTRIGNVLRASEIYPLDHYGIDAVIVWSRLRPLLTDEVVAPLASSKTARNFMLLMSVLSATFTLIWCPALAIFTNRWGLFLMCSLGWPLAWICYQNAIQAARAYSEQLKAIFDLHRYDLLRALNRPIPSDPSAEREEWKNLALFLYRNIPMSPASAVPNKLQSLDEVVTAMAEYLKKVNPPTP